MRTGNPLLFRLHYLHSQLPLGFFAAFFGMNNNDINDAKWMSLNEQIGYMLGLSALVIALSVGLVFSDRIWALRLPLIRLYLENKSEDDYRRNFRRRGHRFTEASGIGCARD